MYINTQSFELIGEAGIRAMYPNTSFPAPFTPPSLFSVVVPKEKPSFNPVIQDVLSLSPIKTMLGDWEERWSVVNKFVTQEAANIAIAASTEAARIAAVPSSVTMRQARIALSRAGLLGAVQTAITALPSQQREEAQIEWDYSSEVQRYNGFVSSLGPLMNLTPLQIDNLFITAAQL
jgi:hypothetical protein